MTDIKTIPMSTKLLELRDVVGFSAEYVKQILPLVQNAQQQEIVSVICSNLERVKNDLEIELDKLDEGAVSEPYNPANFTDVAFLKTNMAEEVIRLIASEESLVEKQALNKGF